VRWLATLVLLVLLGACKSDGDRDAVTDRAAREVRELKDKLGALEQEATVLTARIDAVDTKLEKLTAELATATDDKARAAIEAELEKVKLEREDIERALDELRKKLEP